MNSPSDDWSEINLVCRATAATPSPRRDTMSPSFIDSLKSCNRSVAVCCTISTTTLINHEDVTGFWNTALRPCRGSYDLITEEMVFVWEEDIGSRSAEADGVNSSPLGFCSGPQFLPRWMFLPMCWANSEYFKDVFVNMQADVTRFGAWFIGTKTDHFTRRLNHAQLDEENVHTFSWLIQAEKPWTNTFLLKSQQDVAYKSNMSAVIV